MPQDTIRHGDIDYAVAGVGYAGQRRADPHLAAAIWGGLGEARTVLNVGAGTGNYEPGDRTVVAVEPDATMRGQRPLQAAPCVIGTAQALPFDDASFDAAMAICTIHQWTDLEAGLGELRRVARDRVVILTFDPEAFHRHWFYDYAPDIVATEAQRCPGIERVCALLGGQCAVEEVAIPLNCTDGINEAFYGRPEMLLLPEVRASQSVWRKHGPEAEQAFATRLGQDLASGAWDRRYGHLRSQPFFQGSLRLVIGRP